jgi:hypothetical protein
VQASVLGEIGAMTGEVERRTAEGGAGATPQAAGEVEALREQLAKRVLHLEQLNKQVRAAPPPRKESSARGIIHWLGA